MLESNSDTKSTTDSSVTSGDSNNNVVRVIRAAAAPDTTNYDVNDIYNYYSSKGSTISKQRIQNLIDYKNNLSSVTAILDLSAADYGEAWVDQALNKKIAVATTFKDKIVDELITTNGNKLVTSVNSKIDEQLTKLTELQQQYPNSKDVKNAIDKLNEAKNQVTLENIYNVEKMKDVIDTLDKYGSVSAYENFEKAAELDNAKTD
ncbi:hypothetical protein, partial [Limosilactobacillus ingluviei]|uniref:hypothetical protein n=1 Tax=Limosilactobacillus ingluviei TaxID=148604 RepID=UPI00058D6AB4